ncbi:MAG TPA: glycosyltransferase family 2 protein [Anaeromyxobacteraceae bacterium]|nr:glycosyltransferase family 2 protein [Anaeromyxobacteraceae bacterium]
MSEREPSGEEKRPKLSVCIATFKRARFIGETLQSILSQLEPGVEVVVVDGASPDETAAVVAPLAAAYPALRYHREPVNSGVDADYDKAVAYARGDYCWLMSDDDLLMPGAVARVLAAVADRPDLLIVNAETRTPDLAQVVDPALLPPESDRDYGPQDRDALFLATASTLSFIGAMVIRREVWLARERARYHGSLFAHVGVVFQDPPLEKVRVLAQPLVRIRWGNAMWTSRGFEIWMFKWPALIWSLEGIPASARAAVCPREPWRNLRMVGLHRALGGYSSAEYRTWLAGRGERPFRLLARIIAELPTGLANALAAAYCLLVARGARRELYDLAYGRNATWVARWAARRRGL